MFEGRLPLLQAVYVEFEQDPSRGRRPLSVPSRCAAKSAFVVIIPEAIMIAAVSSSSRRRGIVTDIVAVQRKDQGAETAMRISSGDTIEKDVKTLYRNDRQTRRFRRQIRQGRDRLYLD